MSFTNPSVCPKNARLTQRGTLYDASYGRVIKKHPAPAQRDSTRAYNRVDRRARKRTRSQGGASQTDVAPARKQKQAEFSERVIPRSTSGVKHAVLKSEDVVFNPKPNGDDTATPIEPAREGAPGSASMAHPKELPVDAETTSALVPPNACSAAAKPEGLETGASGSSNGTSPQAPDEPHKCLLAEPARKYLNSLLRIKPTPGDLALQARYEEKAKRRALERKPSTYIPGDISNRAHL
ncbi:uncharacterized protein SCHCODRAFT_02667297 [Schizophyllum commune H4-8]|uniref:Uncharacterized protein n=1 Tax=Schizophyllum commune (strain H4-8 / FGSC 9210) TaxID=578458 RepID=D8PL02_SCHCM|nr:uncharacterized protein SCHCODRAFT_02667297 [Schizophyllum commune H4-8]KAI5894260.1 hypothetical protein SCHCODRAFT_02667297 [Schizophyllum commune H4-8]